METIAYIGFAFIVGAIIGWLSNKFFPSQSQAILCDNLQYRTNICGFLQASPMKQC